MQAPLRSDFLESDVRGFRTTWLVAEDYRLEDGLVKPVAKGELVSVAPFEENAVQRYLPMARPELPFEFSKIETAEHIVSFCKRYGLIGYLPSVQTTLDIYTNFQLAMTLPSDDENDERPTTVATRQRDFQKFYHPGLWEGEPISWILNHAETVRFLLNLFDALTDSGKLKSIIERLTIGGAANRMTASIQCKYAVRGSLYNRTYLTSRRGESDVEFSQGIIQHILNENLVGGVTREIIVDLEPESIRSKDRALTFISAFRANSLLDAIYWHLADAITVATVKRCLYCKRFFNATHLKRLYCPPPMGINGEGSCAINDRAKRKRQRQREKVRKQKKASRTKRKT